MGKLKFSYPAGYATKFGVAVQPPDAIYADDLYPEETLERFRSQGVVITPVDDPHGSATDSASVADASNSPAPITPGVGDENPTEGTDSVVPSGKRSRK